MYLSCSLELSEGCLIAQIDIVGKGKIGECFFGSLDKGDEDYDIQKCIQAAIGDALMHPECVDATELRALWLSKPQGLDKALRLAIESGSGRVELAEWSSDQFKSDVPSRKPHPEYQGE